MKHRHKVGIVGGNGWLGSAIGLAMLEAGVIEPRDLCVSSRSGLAPSFADWPDVEAISDNAVLAQRSDVIVLSVRPQQFPDIGIDAGGKLVVSVMAGVAMKTLQTRCGSDRVVRAMPNAAAEIRRSYSPWCASAAVTDSDKTFVQAMFEASGTADEVPDEAAIDYLTALSGSGPAFPALLAAAMLEHARRNGLGEAVARRAVAAVVTDAAQLMRAASFSPEDMVKTFIDYRGTTAAGLQAMLDHGFKEAVGAGLGAATEKAAAMAASEAG
ncbi:pyrroline-5-carboxylate reductase family protein [Mesorhizobium sp. SP-1A]|uniref:pyrroline-5-carboxylate reductase family protein n=1 Tax=Mesorhizobium sp. SP-1A TaxID=3077840 RepID=UPI0028F70F38|nr:pyrroline-5-carboxylate reductase dimerization domain-containing protein [Mesorhizobium sp. SP-1A]